MLFDHRDTLRRRVAGRLCVYPDPTLSAAAGSSFWGLGRQIASLRQLAVR